MATLETRLQALEKQTRPETWEILNPRYFDFEPGEVVPTYEEHERQNAERIAAAVRAGKRIIRLQPLHNFGD